MAKTTNKIWTEEEDLWLRQNYPTMDLIHICKILKRPPDSIMSRASGKGIRKIKRRSNRSYELNAAYFDKIDCPRKAYWYGFLWADGSLYNNNFELALQDEDLYLIEQFKEDISSSHKIKKHNKYNTFRFLFSSREFSENLNKLNITNRKSYSSLCPIISDIFFKYFLLGLFDGDGTINNKGGITITCSESVSKWLYSNILRIYNIKGKIYNIKGTIAKRFSIHKKFHVKTIFGDIYKKSNIFLKRKKQKYENVYGNIQNGDEISEV